MRYLPHLIAVMLLLAWLDMPYGYYMFLRLSVAAYAVFCFIQHLHSPSRHRELFLILSAGLFLLYQPIIKVPFDREIWQWVNLATVGVVYTLTRRDNPAKTEI